jgi:hypothetical protein
VDFPESFARSNRQVQFPIKKADNTADVEVDACVDDFFIDCALRNGFMFMLRYSRSQGAEQPQESKSKSHHSKSSHSKHSKHSHGKQESPPTSDGFTDEILLLDGSLLFMTNRNEISCSGPFEGFDDVTLIVKTEDRLLSRNHIERFCPAFVHFLSTENVPKNSTGFVPVFFTCAIAGKRFNLLPRGGDKREERIDTAIAIAPRKEVPVTFEVHDKEYEFPVTSSFRGNGFFKTIAPIPHEKEYVKVAAPIQLKDSSRPSSRHHVKDENKVKEPATEAPPSPRRKHHHDKSEPSAKTEEPAVGESSSQVKEHRHRHGTSSGPEKSHRHHQKSEETPKEESSSPEKEHRHREKKTEETPKEES